MSPRKEADVRVLAAIADLTKEKGYPPTFREVAHRLGIYHSVVHYHVVRLREAGHLYAPDARIARGLGLTDRGRRALSAASNSRG